MLQQLVARQRWHSVLLGRPAAKLAKDKTGVEDAQLLEITDYRKWTINLGPGR
jgi:hypothetical protein